MFCFLFHLFFVESIIQHGWFFGGLFQVQSFLRYKSRRLIINWEKMAELRCFVAGMCDPAVEDTPRNIRLSSLS